jgi:hypothetical protein
LLYEHILAELEVQQGIFGPHLRTRDMEDAPGSYSHEEKTKGIHVIMGHFEIESKRIRDKEEHVDLVVTMRSL